MSFVAVIPETPNTENELTLTVAAAYGFLKGAPAADMALLRKLGHEASLAARAMRRPTGVVPVVGKPWPSEKSYTFDVLREVFRLNPATAQYMPKTEEVES